jgi:hypothetical protein
MWRFRTNWRGKLILQRSYRVPALVPGDWNVRWRDATTEDLGHYYAAQCKENK